MSVFIISTKSLAIEGYFKLGRTTLSQEMLIPFYQEFNQPILYYFLTHPKHEKILQKLLFILNPYKTKNYLNTSNWFKLSPELLNHFIHNHIALNLEFEQNIYTLPNDIKKEIKGIFKRSIESDYDISYYDAIRWFGYNTDGEYLSLYRKEMFFFLSANKNNMLAKCPFSLYQDKDCESQNGHYLIYCNCLNINTPMFSKRGFRILASLYDYNYKSDMLNLLNDIHTNY